MSEGGGLAWEFLQRWSAYDSNLRRRWPGPALPEPAPFPLRLQTGADLKAARWGLLAWEHPDEFRGVSPFWAVAPTLEVGVAPEATPLLPRLEELGASLSGLRLAGGALILKIELGRAAAQLRIAAGTVPNAEDGVVAEHDLLLGPSVFIARLENACALAAGEVPLSGGGRGMKRRNFSRRSTRSTPASRIGRSRSTSMVPPKSRRTGTATAGCGR